MRVQTTRALSEGLVAGAVGYAVVAVVFALLNVAAGNSPFYTASMMGEALFYGGRESTALAAAAGPILAYNGLHLLAFLVFGAAGALLVAEVERHPQLFYPALLLVIFAALFGLATMVTFAAVASLPLEAKQVGTATVLATLGMGLYLWVAHPRLREEFRGSAHDEVPEL